MTSIARNFFQFAGAHSLLIGLLPFFIPVLLLKQGNSIEVIALFIASLAEFYFLTKAMGTNLSSG